MDLELQIHENKKSDPRYLRLIAPIIVRRSFHHARNSRQVAPPAVA